jgi:hypothetical protein
MKPYTQRFQLILIVALACFSSLCYGQKINIIDRPVAAAFPFANVIAAHMRLSAPDSAHLKLTNREMRIELSAPDSAKRWVMIDYILNDAKDMVKEVRITGDVAEIIDLYVSLYDNKASDKVKNGKLSTAIRSDGEWIGITSSHMAMYKRVNKFWGVISIEKSEGPGK